MENIFLVSTGLLVAGIFHNIYRGQEIESLPSIFWLFIMVMPFWFQRQGFPYPYQNTQALGISIISLAILIGDSLIINKKHGVISESSGIGILGKARIYAILFVMLSIYHLTLLEHIPLFEKFFSPDIGDRALQWMREATSKLLSVNDIVKYLFTWSNNIIAPLAIILFLHERKYILAGIMFLLAVVYALMSLAKVPVFILLIVLAVASLRKKKPLIRARIYALILIVILPFMFHASVFLNKHHLSVLNYKGPDDAIIQYELDASDPRLRLTLGDNLRLAPSGAMDSLTTLQRIYNYYIYRLFLGPSDVSSRWYQYFPDVSQGFIGIYALTSESRRDAISHPARQVGKWAYTDRFPEKYLETAQAYASVDADAYARYGILGIIVAGILVALTRVTLRSLLSDKPESQALYSVGLVLISVLWPMASIQAVLVSNGVAIVILLMGLSRLDEIYRLKKVRADTHA